MSIFSQMIKPINDKLKKRLFRESVETKFEYKIVDWNKVTTVEDVVNILKNIRITHRVRVGKIEWDNPIWSKLLDDKVYTRTWTKYGVTDDGDK